MRLLQRNPGASLVLLEKESALAMHQTGHNSGVIHSGIYYAPGSLKADLCKRGERATKAFCTEHDIPFITCGKTLVATSPLELRADGGARRARRAERHRCRASGRQRTAPPRAEHHRARRALRARDGHRRLSTGVRRDGARHRVARRRDRTRRARDHHRGDRARRHRARRCSRRDGGSAHRLRRPAVRPARAPRRSAGDPSDRALPRRILPPAEREERDRPESHLSDPGSRPSPSSASISRE